MADSRLVILKEAHLLSDKDWASLDEAFDHFFPYRAGEVVNSKRILYNTNDSVCCSSSSARSKKKNH